MNQLKDILSEAQDTVNSGYYRPAGEIRPAVGLTKSLREGRGPGGASLWVEIERPAPQAGRAPEGGIEGVLARLGREGVGGFVVPTDPNRLGGSVGNLRVATRSGRPVLMRDFVVVEEQIDFAAHVGASAVVLLPALLPPRRLVSLVEYCRLAERESVLEVSDALGLEKAEASEADAVLLHHQDWRSRASNRTAPASILKVAAAREKPLLVAADPRAPADPTGLRGLCDAVVIGSNALAPSYSLEAWAPR